MDRQLGVVRNPPTTAAGESHVVGVLIRSAAVSVAVLSVVPLTVMAVFVGVVWVMAAVRPTANRRAVAEDAGRAVVKVGQVLSGSSGVRQQRR